IDLYEKADAKLAPKMEAILAARWKAAGDPKLPVAAKAAAIRKSMAASDAASKISPAERKKRLQQLVAKTLSPPAKPAGQPENAALQDAARMAHASTMSSILLGKDAEVWRFDELIGAVPESGQGKPANEPKKPPEKPRPPGEKEVIEVGAGWTVQDSLTDKSD